MYGAKFIALRIACNTVDNKPADNSKTNENTIDDFNNENDKYRDKNSNELINQKVLSLKTTGLLVMMAGCILVLVAFK